MGSFRFAEDKQRAHSVWCGRPVPTNWGSHVAGSRRFTGGLLPVVLGPSCPKGIRQRAQVNNAPP